MANLYLVANNVGDTATVTGTTADSSYPASNVQVVARGSVFRTTSVAASRELKFTWSSNQRVDVVALARVNLTTSATVRVYFYSDVAWTTQIADSGAVTAFDSADFGANATFTAAHVKALKSYAYKHASVLTTVKSIKVSIEDTGNTDAYIEVARAFVGEAQTVTRNAAYGAAMEWYEDGASQRRMLSGSLRTVSGAPPCRRWALEMRTIPAADRLIWSDLYRYCGPRRDFWFSLYPGDGTSREIEGQGVFKFQSVGRLSHELPAYDSTSYVITEA